MTEIAERIARLNHRASEAVAKAKSGRTRIKGDGDGDGIPYEGRGKKGGTGGGPSKATPEPSANSAYAQWQARIPGHMEMISSLKTSPYERITEVLRAEKPSSWKARYHPGDGNAAIRAGAKIAVKENTPVIVTQGNAKMFQGWQVQMPGSPTLRGTMDLAKLGKGVTFIINPDLSARKVEWD